MKKVKTDYKKELKEFKELYNSPHELDNWLLYEYFRIKDQQLLFEFITQTISKEKTINQLEKRFNKKYIKIVEQDDFYIIMDPLKIDIKTVLKFMDSFGWFPAIYIVDNTPIKYKENKVLDLTVPFAIRFEAKYDHEVTVKDEYIYHITTQKNYKKIQRDGLTPKNKAKISNHPERIYFLIVYNDSNLVHFISELIQEPGYILKINVNKCKNKGTKFYNDPNFDICGLKSIWTYQNIPPTFIQIEQEI